MNNRTCEQLNSELRIVGASSTRFQLFACSTVLLFNCSIYYSDYV